MIISKLFYNVECDCCHETINEMWYDDKGGAHAESHDSDVLDTADGKHYCYDCYDVDDNDNYVTKDGHIYDGETKDEINKITNP